MDLRGWNLAFALLLLLAPLLMAGCTDDPNDAEVGPEPTPTDDENRPAVVAPDARPVVFPAGGANETHWWNGTFEAYNNQDTVGDLTEEVGVDAGAYHRYDVSELLPQGVLLRVATEVEADLAEGDLDVWLELPGTAQRVLQADAPYGGWSRVEYILVLTDGSPVELVVRHDEMEPAAFDYTLHMQVATETVWLPGGIAIGIELGDEDELDVVPELEDAPDVAVWGPDGTFIGRLPVNEGAARIDAAELEGAGRYVLLREDGGGDARLYLNASGDIETMFPAMRWERGDVHEADGPVEWTWSTEEVPVVIGLALEIDAPQNGDVSASVTGPEGELLRFQDGVTLTIGFGLAFTTRSGAAGLVPGDYTFEVTPGDTVPTEPTRAQRITAFLDLGA